MASPPKNEKQIYFLHLIFRYFWFHIY